MSPLPAFAGLNQFLLRSSVPERHGAAPGLGHLQARILVQLTRAEGPAVNSPAVKAKLADPSPRSEDRHSDRAAPVGAQ